MKKKSMALGALLMAVAVTGYSVSGTYAKYISSVDIIDDARVAKWDFNTDQTMDLFASSYKLVGDNGEYTYVQSLGKTTDADGNEIADDVVAPGTHGTARVEFSGETETNYKFSFEVNEVINNVRVLSTDAENTTGKNYNPIIFNVKYGYVNEFGGLVYDINESSKDYSGSLEDTINAVNEKLDKVVFGPANNANVQHYLEISWSWAFDAYDVVRANSSNGDDAWNYTNEYIDQNFSSDLEMFKNVVNDELDTLLGSRAADGEDLTVKVNLKAVVEQTKEEATR